jgi:ribosomal protein L34
VARRRNRLADPLAVLLAGADEGFRQRHGSPWPSTPQEHPMKLKVRRSSLKRKKKVGFRTRSKTAGGRKVIKRKIRRSGKFRVG